ncbi:MAG: hypothetical protein ACYCPR_05495 [Thermoplasmataceae archaeon]
MLGEAIEAAIREITEIKKRIENFRSDLAKNEALVRYSLIDPFLRLLGWDTANPSQVVPEYSTGTGRADYALIDTEGNILAFLGAKKLGTPEDINQHITYCNSSAVSYFIATDGDIWELYDVFKKVKIPEKRIARWVISEEKPGEIIRKALVISNFSEFGNYYERSDYGTSEVIGSPPARRETFLEAQKKEKRASPTRPKKLVILGETLSVSKVREVLIQTAEWLIRNRKLRVDRVPIESGPIRYIVNSRPVHKSGTPFFDAYKLSNGLFLEVHGSHQAVENNALVLMRNFGFGEETIEIKWGEE